MSAFKGVRISKFRHVYGQTTRRENCYEGLRITTSAHDSQFCAVNPKFIAVVVDVAGGGAFHVLPLSWTGKLDYDLGRVSGHNGPVTDIKWNPFNDNVIASASDDGTIKLWCIPDSVALCGVREWLCELGGHSRRVAYLEWHPTAEGILASVGHDCRLLIWNVTTGDCTLEISHPDTIYSISFNRLGNRMVTACKDKKIRILDPRTGETISEGNGHEGSKTSKVVFVGDDDLLFSTGFSRTSRRQIAMWHEKELGRPLLMQEIDASSGVLFPFYDPDLKLIFLAGKGDGNIRYYEVSNTSPWLHYLTEFQSRFPQRGLGVLPKRAIDPSRCEIIRFYKLHSTQTLVEPLSFIVPRKSDQFQADLYPPTSSPTAAVTAEEWLCGLDREPVLTSLRIGFKPVTSKPVQLKKQATVEGDKALLVTADHNNEKKFRFLAQITKADYRVVTDREDYSVILKEKTIQQKLSRVSKSQDSTDSGRSESSLRMWDKESGSENPSEPPKSPGALSAPVLSPVHRPSAPFRSSSSGNSPLKIRKISTGPGRVSCPPPVSPPSSAEAGAGVVRNGASSSKPSMDSLPRSERGSSSSDSDNSDDAPLPTSTIPVEKNGTAPKAFTKPPPSPFTRSKANRVETKPGRIGPGHLVPREQTAHIKPFRVSQSQPSTPRTLPTPSLPAVDVQISSAKGEAEVKRLYAAQCRRVRELMEDADKREERTRTLESEVASLNQRLAALLHDSARQTEDISSLRYEIQWKDERIRFLEESLTKS